MTYDRYCAEYGNVRISPLEAYILTDAFNMRGIDDIVYSPEAKLVIAKAEAIKEACERFAKYRADMIKFQDFK